jgi:hypothetical protein
MMTDQQMDPVTDAVYGIAQTASDALNELKVVQAELEAIRAIVDRATTQCGLGAAIAEHFGADLPRTD